MLPGPVSCSFLPLLPTHTPSYCNPSSSRRFCRFQSFNPSDAPRGAEPGPQLAGSKVATLLGEGDASENYDSQQVLHLSSPTPVVMAGYGGPAGERRGSEAMRQGGKLKSVMWPGWSGSECLYDRHCEEECASDSSCLQVEQSSSVSLECAQQKLNAHWVLGKFRLAVRNLRGLF